MRTFFSSVTRPKHVAERLHRLLPALSHAQCLCWTANVFGYRDWHDLASVVKAGLEPATPEMGGYPAHPEAVRALIAHVQSQRSTLYKLLGDHAFLGERLYEMWSPYLPGAPTSTLVKDLGKGATVFKLLQHDSFWAHEPEKSGQEWDSHKFGHGTIVTELPTGRDAELIRTFLSDVSRSRLPYPGYAKQMEQALKLRIGESWNKTVVEFDPDEDPEDDDPPPIRLGFGTQYYSVPLFALSEAGRLVGAAVLRYTFTSTVSGRYNEMKIDIVEAVALNRDANIVHALATTAVDVFQPSVFRYLLCRVGSPDQEVSVTYLAESESPDTWAIAQIMDELISDELALPGLDEPAGRGLDIGPMVAP